MYPRSLRGEKSLRLVQLRMANNRRAVAALDEQGIGRVIEDCCTVYDLACGAIAAGLSLPQHLAKYRLGEPVEVRSALSEERVLTPLDHPYDLAHMIVSGTGLTHLGSAHGRNDMHAGASGQDITDSMKMFILGKKSGKADRPSESVQPEWFYKGDGLTVVAPEQPFISPEFALDGSEEPEIAGLYIIGPDGVPYRLGFALGNEFSDHVTETFNYLWLAHSKLRPCSFGPELLVDDLPASVSGKVRIVRDGATIYENKFLSGEENMNFSIRNLEWHHFKYANFRRPGDVHIHFFGTSTLSYSAGVQTMPGDIFEVEADTFQLPLRNRLEKAAPHALAMRLDNDLHREQIPFEGG